MMEGVGDGWLESGQRMGGESMQSHEILILQFVMGRPL